MSEVSGRELTEVRDRQPTDGSRKSAVPGVTTATTGYTGQAEIGKGLTEVGDPLFALRASQDRQKSARAEDQGRRSD